MKGLKKIFAPVEVLLVEDNPDLLLQDSQRLGTLMAIHQQAPKVPIVVFTGLEDDVVGLWALSEGAEDYIVKGKVSGDSLAYTIRDAIERHGKEQQLANPRKGSRKEPVR